MTDDETDRGRGHSGPGAAIDLEIVDACGALDASALGWLRDHAGRAARALGAEGQVRVRVVGDGEMAAAHRRYKGLEGPTDVLTFDLSEGGTLDVDVLIGAGEAARRASELGHPVERELLLYIVHAMLHCTGYDDHDESEAARMHAREDEILERIGVGATYMPASHSPRPGAAS